ncbi:MAG: hypothetical protein ACYC2I_01590 [Elusimicrobiales bacterium]
MTTKIALVLSMSLNVMLAFVIVDNNRKPVSLGDIRDAVADTGVPVPPVEAAPVQTELVPPPAAETVLTDAVPAEAAVETPVPAPEPVVANDWAAYRQEMTDDKDVLVSNIFRSEKNGERAMTSAVSRLYAAGKDVLFSCLLPATGGGFFYLIRLAPAAQEIPRLASMADVSNRDYLKEIQFITDMTEKEVWGSI